MKKNGSKDQWLNGIKSLIFDLVIRERVISDLCPRCQPGPQERKRYLRELADKNKDVSIGVKNLLEMETEKFGISLLLPKATIDEETALVLYVGIAARLDSEFSHMVRYVGSIVSMVAVRDAPSALKVRNLFRDDSDISQLICVGQGYTVLDDRPVILRESVFNKATGNNPDMTATQCDAVLYTSHRWR